MSGEAFIDASLFMGMHSSDDRIRRSCKRFFVERLETGAVMSLEQVGRCDDLVWGFPREVQDAYYPFMDVLHTDMKIDRIGYADADLALAAAPGQELTGLPVTDRLTLAMVLNRGARLHTVNPRLVGRAGLPLDPLPEDAESVFPPELEQLYQDSLVLSVAPDDV
ncbi:hypothetical protein F0L68_23060 [Solihabitans fulvus]|uniref:PIN domain-containing protein n=1 Tax=Solihabitans fulvus TaxID=1892852 RepID=A0A5B2X672_9PSEU|nr:DUF6190 family protein [Solihabitans fulvus]KAA2258720.1 hypothetical protein F0L68_23060 [Solihabitans fulvus]